MPSVSICISSHSLHICTCCICIKNKNTLNISYVLLAFMWPKNCRFSKTGGWVCGLGSRREYVCKIEWLHRPLWLWVCGEGGMACSSVMVYTYVPPILTSVFHNLLINILLFGHFSSERYLRCPCLDVAPECRKFDPPYYPLTPVSNKKNNKKRPLSAACGLFTPIFIWMYTF